MSGHRSPPTGTVSSPTTRGGLAIPPSSPPDPEPAHRAWSRRRRLDRLLDRVRTLPYRHDLTRLARFHETDKATAHRYTAPYMERFRALRRRRLVLWEIGIGGYADPYDGGGSLRMWKDYFPRAQIVGLDLHDKSRFEERRIRVFQGDQSDPAFLRRVHDAVGPPDLVIDDGSHRNDHVLATFRALFPLLRDGGQYVVEDVQTAYWPEYGGAPPGDPSVPTSMRRFQALTDDLNHREWLPGARAPDPFAGDIVEIAFLHNLVFVRKGRNDEPSNVVRG